MSRTLPLIAVLAVMAIIIGTFYLIARRHTQNTFAEGPIMLYSEGEVSYRNGTQTDFQKASSTTQLANTSQVKTASGTATILLPDNSNIALGSNSAVTLNYDGTHVSVFQDSGMTYHRVLSQLKGATYQVRTINGLISADGTKFAVIYSPSGITKVGVTEHQVESSQVAAATSSQPIHTQVLVEGKAEIITKENSPQIIDLSTDSDLENWVGENKARDQDVDNLENSHGGDLHQALSDLFSNLLSATVTALVPSSTTTQATTATTSKTPVSVTATTSSTGKATSTPTSTSTNATSTSSSTPPSSSFLSKFHELFTEYFYLDEKDTPCRFSVTPEERVGIVTNFARESGHSFTSDTLLDFANQIDAYCSAKEKDRNSDLKQTLRSRFSAEYPFRST